MCSLPDDSCRAGFRRSGVCESFAVYMFKDIGFDAADSTAKRLHHWHHSATAEASYPVIYFDQ